MKLSKRAVHMQLAPHIIDEIIAVQCARMCSFERARDIVLERQANEAAAHEARQRTFGAAGATQATSSPPEARSPRGDQAAAPIRAGHQKPFSDAPWGIAPPAERMRAGR